MALVSSAQAAKKLGITSRQVGRLCASGLLRALHVGRAWVIDEASLMARYAMRTRRGRPKKGGKRMSIDDQFPMP